MRTLFVVSEEFVDNHVGEEYDSILEVEHQPTTQTIQEWANRVRGRIRKLWQEDPDDSDKRVVVSFDAAPPFNTMLIDLQLILKESENIIVELPYLEESTQQLGDEEAQQLVDRMEGKIQ